MNIIESLPLIQKVASMALRLDNWNLSKINTFATSIDQQVADSILAFVKIFNRAVENVEIKNTRRRMELEQRQNEAPTDVINKMRQMALQKNTTQQNKTTTQKDARELINDKEEEDDDDEEEDDDDNDDDIDEAIIVRTEESNTSGAAVDTMPVVSKMDEKRKEAIRKEVRNELDTQIDIILEHWTSDSSPAGGFSFHVYGISESDWRKAYKSLEEEDEVIRIRADIAYYVNYYHRLAGLDPIKTINEVPYAKAFTDPKYVDTIRGDNPITISNYKIPLETFTEWAMIRLTFPWDDSRNEFERAALELFERIAAEMKIPMGCDAWRNDSNPAITALKYSRVRKFTGDRLSDVVTEKDVESKLPFHLQFDPENAIAMVDAGLSFARGDAEAEDEIMEGINYEQFTAKRRREAELRIKERKAYIDKLIAEEKKTRRAHNARIAKELEQMRKEFRKEREEFYKSAKKNADRQSLFPFDLSSDNRLHYYADPTYLAEKINESLRNKLKKLVSDGKMSEQEMIALYELKTNEYWNSMWQSTKVNDKMPESVKGLSKFREEYANYVINFKFASRKPGMSSLWIYFDNMVMIVKELLGLRSTTLEFLLCFYGATNSFAKVLMHLHFFASGDAGIGKSYMLLTLCTLLIAGTWVEHTINKSQKAEFAWNPDNFVLAVYPEAPNMFYTPPDKMNAQMREMYEGTKQLLTSPYVNYQYLDWVRNNNTSNENAPSSVTARQSKTLSKISNKTYAVVSNKNIANSAPIQDRFIALSMGTRTNKDDPRHLSFGKAVEEFAKSFLAETLQHEISMVFKITQFFVDKSHLFFNIGAGHGGVTKLGAELVINRVLDLIQQKGVPTGKQRHCDRAIMLAYELCLHRIVMELLFLHGSPFAGKKLSEVDTHAFYREVQKRAIVSEDDALAALCMVGSQWFPPLHSGIIKVLKNNILLLSESKITGNISANEKQMTYFTLHIYKKLREKNINYISFESKEESKTQRGNTDEKDSELQQQQQGQRTTFVRSHETIEVIDPNYIAIQMHNRMDEMYKVITNYLDPKPSVDDVRSTFMSMNQDTMIPDVMYETIPKRLFEEALITDDEALRIRRLQLLFKTKTPTPICPVRITFDKKQPYLLVAVAYLEKAFDVRIMYKVIENEYPYTGMKERTIPVLDFATQELRELRLKSPVEKKPFTIGNPSYKNADVEAWKAYLKIGVRSTMTTTASMPPPKTTSASKRKNNKHIVDSNDDFYEILDGLNDEQQHIPQALPLTGNRYTVMSRTAEDQLVSQEEFLQTKVPKVADAVRRDAQLTKTMIERFKEITQHQQIVINNKSVDELTEMLHYDKIFVPVREQVKILLQTSKWLEYSYERYANQQTMMNCLRRLSKQLLVQQKKKHTEEQMEIIKERIQNVKKELDVDDIIESIGGGIEKEYAQKKVQEFLLKYQQNLEFIEMGRTMSGNGTNDADVKDELFNDSAPYGDKFIVDMDSFKPELIDNDLDGYQPTVEFNHVLGDTENDDNSNHIDELLEGMVDNSHLAARQDMTEPMDDLMEMNESQQTNSLEIEDGIVDNEQKRYRNESTNRAKSLKSAATDATITTTPTKKKRNTSRVTPTTSPHKKQHHTIMHIDNEFINDERETSNRRGLPNEFLEYQRNKRKDSPVKKAELPKPAAKKPKFASAGDKIKEPKKT